MGRIADALKRAEQERRRALSDSVPDEGGVAVAVAPRVAPRIDTRVPTITPDVTAEPGPVVEGLAHCCIRSLARPSVVLSAADELVENPKPMV